MFAIDWIRYFKWWSLIEKQKFSLGDMVRVKATGQVGKIMCIGGANLKSRKWSYRLDTDDFNDLNSMDERHDVDNWYAEELELTMILKDNVV